MTLPPREFFNGGGTAFPDGNHARAYSGAGLWAAADWDCGFGRIADYGAAAGDLEHVNRSKDVQRLREIARKQQARYDTGGPSGASEWSAGRDGGGGCAFCAARLEKELGIPVELVDERLTSWEAAQTMAETRPASRSGSKAGKQRSVGSCGGSGAVARLSGTRAGQRERQ